MPMLAAKKIIGLTGSYAIMAETERKIIHATAGKMNGSDRKSGRGVIPADNRAPPEEVKRDIRGGCTFQKNS